MNYNGFIAVLVDGLQAALHEARKERDAYASDLQRVAPTSASLRYGSVCSGIEAATVAWHGLGWEPAWFCEINPFASAVLAHRFPEVPNHGDFTQLLDPAHAVRQPGTAPIDVLVGGTPCQSFSVAGKREGLDDPRGQLMLAYVRLVEALRPRWIVWENVPGVLSSGGGRDFGALLGALADLGYGFAYRVLDARHFGVPQRRRRVFVVGHSGGCAERAAEILFEPDCLRGNPTARREAREEDPGGTGVGAAKGGAARRVAADTADPWMSAVGSGCDGPADDVSGASPTRMLRESGPGWWAEDSVAGALDASMGASGHANRVATVFQPLTASAHPPAVAIQGRTSVEWAPDCAAPPSVPAQSGGFRTTDLDNSGAFVVTSFDWQSTDMPILADEASTVTSTHTSAVCVDVTVVPPAAASRPPPATMVRRLTPRECERLQGFPDDWTMIPFGKKKGTQSLATDGHRYKAIGNSMAVPVMRWIGERIARAERDALRAIIEGRATAPTPDECRAHNDARGCWLVQGRDGKLAVLVGFVTNTTIVRWWSVSANMRLCAWPKVG